MDVQVYLSGPLGVGLDEVEDALGTALGDRGEVVGTGTGPTGSNFDLEVLDPALGRAEVLELVNESFSALCLPHAFELVVNGQGGRSPGFWGGALRSWPVEVMEDPRLPGGVGDYLARVGLPAGIDWTLQVDPTTPLTTLEGNDGLVVVLWDGPASICVESGRADARIVVVEPSGNVRLVNSGLPTLGRFLVSYQQYRLAVRGADEATADRLVSAAKQRMRGMDPPAMENAESYWSVILEQMRTGLL